MLRVLVLYYSRTGNTEKMAQAIVDGAKTVAGTAVELEYHVNAEELSGYDAIIVGVSTYYHDMPMDVKRLFEEAAEKGISLKSKAGAAFGSYGWTGEAPRLVLEIMKNKFEMHVNETPLLVRYAPDQNSLSLCRQLGKRVSETLIRKA
jgi:flavorubredoxin